MNAIDVQLILVNSEFVTVSLSPQAESVPPACLGLTIVLQVRPITQVLLYQETGGSEVCRLVSLLVL